MNPAIKTKWLVALRSGDYPQTRRRLRDDDGFCCMGVLCDVVDPEGWSAYNNGTFRSSRAFPPPSVIDEAGLYDGRLCALGITGIMGDLANLNDNMGLSFPEIADYIEENL